MATAEGTSSVSRRSGTFRRPALRFAGALAAFRAAQSGRARAGFSNTHQKPYDREDYLKGQLEALIATINRSAERVQTLWISFILFMLYLAVAAGTTTHRMLLLGSAIKLPVLGIDLPLLGFYVLSPLILVTMHIYLFTQIVLLARMADAFNTAVRELVSLQQRARRAEVEESFRIRLENTPFLQMLAGPQVDACNANGMLLRSVAYLSLSLAPVALLMLIQERFVPYHSSLISFLHRAVVVGDVVLIWFLWSAFRFEGGLPALPSLKRMHSAFCAMLLGMGVLGTFHLGTWTFEPVIGRSHSDLEKGALQSLGIYRQALDLRGEDFVEDDALAKMIAGSRRADSFEERWQSMPGLEFSRRDLTEANFASTDLRRARFLYSDLRGASFTGAWLDGSRFEFSEGEAAEFNGASLEGAMFSVTRFRYASFAAARMQGARFIGSNLDGANFIKASIRYSQVRQSSFKFALLENTDMRTSNVTASIFIGISLLRADLSGSVFQDVLLHGANLSRAKIQGALLIRPSLLGAFTYDLRLDASLVVSADFSKTFRIAPPNMGRYLQDAVSPITEQTLASWRLPPPDPRLNIRHDHVLAAQRLAFAFIRAANGVGDDVWRDHAAQSMGEHFASQAAERLFEIACSVRAFPPVELSIVAPYGLRDIEPSDQIGSGVGLFMYERPVVEATRVRFELARRDAARSCPFILGLSDAEWFEVRRRFDRTLVRVSPR